MSRYECRVARIKSDITTHWILSRMCWGATKLYNTALWHSREVWENTGKIPTGFDLQKTVLASPHHSLLPAHTYQHPAHQVGNAYRSWYKLRKKDPTVHPPGFRKKTALSSLLYTQGAFKVWNRDTIGVTLTTKLKETLSYPEKRLTLRLAWNTPFPDGGQIQQLEIVSREGFFELHAKILLPEPEWKTEGQIITGDMGMRNPIVLIDEHDNVDIFKGGRVLSNLRYFNKTRAHVSKEVLGRTKGKKKYSNTLDRLWNKGNAQVQQGIHALTNAIVDLAVKRDAKEVVVGDLDRIKKDKKTGKGKNWRDKQSQNWQQFPVRKVVAQLAYKLARVCIRLTEQDESWTSKGRCCLCGCTDKTKLHRVKRGMFYCENCNTTQNADTNGAGNQRARYLHQGAMPEGSSGRLARPSVWRFDNHLWKVVA